MSLLRNLSFPREELTEIGFVDSICYVPRKRKILFCRVALLFGLVLRGAAQLGQVKFEQQVVFTNGFLQEF